jgi:hypothetical protein
LALSILQHRPASPATSDAVRRVLLGHHDAQFRGEREVG